MSYVPTFVIDMITYYEHSCAITSNDGGQTLFIRRDEINNGRVSFSTAVDQELVSRHMGSPNAHLVLTPATKARIDMWFAGRLA